MNLVFEKLAQLLAAGQVWKLNISADFMRIVTLTFPVKVRIFKAGRILGEMEGWQAGDYMRGVEFDAVEIENGNSAQEVSIQIAGGGVGSDRIVGEVAIIDGKRALTESNKAFMKSAQVATTAGNYGACQLFNPVGSGIVVEVTSAEVSSQVAATYGAGFYGSELDNPVSARSKMSGGDLSKAKIQTRIQTGQFTIQDLAVMNRGAGEPFQWKFDEPILVKEGYGLIVWAATQGAQFTAIFEFREQK